MPQSKIYYTRQATTMIYNQAYKTMARFWRKKVEERERRYSHNLKVSSHSAFSNPYILLYTTACLAYNVVVVYPSSSGSSYNVFSWYFMENICVRKYKTLMNISNFLSQEILYEKLRNLIKSFYRVHKSVYMNLSQLMGSDTG